MNSTLADIKQLFNVKNIAYSTNINNLAEGQFGVFAEGSDVSVASGVTFATLPEQFRIVSKLNGKVYYSFDTINKNNIKSALEYYYQEEEVNIWKGLIEHCNCINGVVLNINVDEQSLIQRDGLTWTHKDFVVEVSPKELLCYCACDGSKPAYENNILTKLLVEKTVANNSPFYTASASMDVSGLTTYANQGALDTAVPAPEFGDLAIVTGSGVKVYDGAAWTVIATVTGEVTDMDAFIAIFKDVNTDDDITNDGPLLYLVISGKPTSGSVYRDLEVNYVYPRGVKLHPALSINDEIAVTFEEEQSLIFEVGAGYDLRAEEFESMSLYTNLNHYPRLSDGIQNPDLVYQFENNTNYNTLTFEFSTDKVERNSGEKRLFSVLLGAEDENIFDELVAMFQA